MAEAPKGNGHVPANQLIDIVPASSPNSLGNRALHTIGMLTQLPAALRTAHDVAQTRSETVRGHAIILSNIQQVEDLADLITVIEANPQSLGIIKAQLGIPDTQGLVEWVKTSGSARLNFRKLQSAIADITQTHEEIQINEAMHGAAVQAAGHAMQPAHQIVAAGETAEMLTPDIIKAQQSLAAFNSAMEQALPERRKAADLRKKAMAIKHQEKLQDMFDQVGTGINQVAGVVSGAVSGVATGLGTALGATGDRIMHVAEQYPIPSAGLTLLVTAYAYADLTHAQIAERLGAMGYPLAAVIGILGVPLVVGIGEAAVNGVANRIQTARTGGHQQGHP